MTHLSRSTLTNGAAVDDNVLPFPLSFDGRGGNHHGKGAVEPVPIDRHRLEKIVRTSNRYLIGLWNAECRLAKRPQYRLEIALGEIQDNEATQKLAHRYLDHEDIGFACDIYPHQVRAAFLIFLALAEDDLDVAFLAVTQWGKTAALCLVILVFNMWQYSDPHRAMLFLRLINPNRIGPSEQTECDLRYWHSIFAAVRFHGVSLQEANKLYFNTTNLTYRKANTYGNLTGEQRILDKLGVNDQTVNQQGYVGQIMMIDEGDEALNQDSYLDKVLSMHNNKQIPFRIVLCSATGPEFRNLEAFKTIVGDIPESYAGFVRGNKRVPIAGFSTMADLTGIEELRGYSVTKDYTKTEIPLRLIYAFHKGIDPNKSCTTFKYNHETNEFTTITTTAREVGLNGKPWNGGEGGMLRCGKSRKQLYAFINRYQHLLADEIGVVLLPFDSTGVCEFPIPGTKGERVPIQAKTIGDTIKQAQLHGVKNYVVCVVDRARRSDRFPPECTIFIDMTERPTAYTTVTQGTIGRATGHGKIVPGRSVFVMISDDVNAVVLKARRLYDVYGLEIPVIKPSQYAVGQYRWPQALRRITIQMDTPEWDRLMPETRRAIHRFGAVLLKNVTFSDKGVPRHSRINNAGPDVLSQTMGDKTSWFLYNLFGLLGDAGIADLSRVYTEKYGSPAPLKLLLPGEKRAGDGKSYVNHGKHIHIALRNGTFVRGNELGQDRLQTVKTMGWSNNVDATALVVPGGLRGITLMLATIGLDRFGASDDALEFTLPSPGTTMYKHRTNQQERETVTVMKDKNHARR